MGVLHYKVIDLKDLTPDSRESTLKELGTQMWNLVAVCNDVAYLSRGPESESIINPDYGVDKAGKDNKNYELKHPENSRMFTSKSTLDGKDEHSHRVRVAIDPEDEVIDFWVEEVFDHTHEVKELGMLSKSNGHAHTFDVDLSKTEEQSE